MLPPSSQQSVRTPAEGERPRRAGSRTRASPSPDPPRAPAEESPRREERAAAGRQARRLQVTRWAREGRRDTRRHHRAVPPGPARKVEKRRRAFKAHGGRPWIVEVTLARSCCQEAGPHLLHREWELARLQEGCGARASHAGAGALLVEAAGGDAGGETDADQ